MAIIGKTTGSHVSPEVEEKETVLWTAEIQDDLSPNGEYIPISRKTRRITSSQTVAEEDGPLEKTSCRKIGFAGDITTIRELQRRSQLLAKQ